MVMILSNKQWGLMKYLDMSRMNEILCKRVLELLKN